MTWYAFVAPVVAVALFVRLEAILLGPYWSWLELVSEIGEDAAIGHKRRRALARRVAIPGLAGFVVVAAWPSVYGSTDSIIVGLSAALLLLWPLIFQGLPWGVRRRRLVAIYLSFVIAFTASSWFGASIAIYAHSKGSIADYLRDNLFGIVVGGVVTLFATGVFQRVSSIASERRGE